MEANIVVKAADLTDDFADGLRKIFSPSALLHIKVEYEMNTPAAAPTGKRAYNKSKSAASSSDSAPKATTGKKRGRKPNPKPEGAATAPAAAPKKRGRKPKVAAE